MYIPTKMTFSFDKYGNIKVEMVEKTKVTEADIESEIKKDD